MPIFVTVMLALCNACWDLVLSRAAMLIKHVLCLVLPTDTTWWQQWDTLKMPDLEERTHQELLPAAGQNQTQTQQPSQLPLPTRFDGADVSNVTG